MFRGGMLVSRLRSIDRPSLVALRPLDFTQCFHASQLTLDPSLSFIRTVPTTCHRRMVELSLHNVAWRRITRGCSTLSNAYRALDQKASRWSPLPSLGCIAVYCMGGRRRGCLRTCLRSLKSDEISDQQQAFSRRPPEADYGRQAVRAEFEELAIETAPHSRRGAADVWERSVVDMVGKFLNTFSAVTN